MMTGTTRFLPTYPTMPHMRMLLFSAGGKPKNAFCELEVRPLLSKRLPDVPQPACRRRKNFASPNRGIRLVFEGETKLFNHRIGQDVAGDARYFRLHLAPIQAAIEYELEIFALAYLFQPLTSHFLERALDRLSLWIQNALLERHVYVSFHGGLQPLYFRNIQTQPNHRLSPGVPAARRVPKARFQAFAGVEDSEPPGVAEGRADGTVQGRPVP